jgi:stearoyl-CoA desaturase (delta-9 desaturase)
MTSHRYQFGLVGLFVVLHASVFGVYWAPFAWRWVALAVFTYSIRMWAVTAGYHRYFSHRSYRMGRIPQFLLAFLAQTSAQKGVLWWVAQHRHHHRHSDDEHDVHSPNQRGFWWSHVGWILSNEFDSYDRKAVSDLAKFPELVFLDRYHWICPILFAAALTALFGVPGLVWGFVISTVVLYHCTFAINSVAHLAGTRRFNTPDGSRNNWLLALVTFGEGWHNNHHYCMSSCRQGYRWWELDVTYIGIRLLEVCGVATGLRPFRVRETEQVRR